MELNDLTGEIVDAAVDVHRTFGGPGLLESIYEEALGLELRLCGFRVDRQIAVPVRYKGYSLMASLRLDLLIDDRVIVECKATSKLSEIVSTQALTYLRLSNRPIALIINFGQRPLRPNIRRIVNSQST